VAKKKIAKVKKKAEPRAEAPVATYRGKTYPRARQDERGFWRPLPWPREIDRKDYASDVAYQAALFLEQFAALPEAVRIEVGLVLCSPPQNTTVVDGSARCLWFLTDDLYRGYIGAEHSALLGDLMPAARHGKKFGGRKADKDRDEGFRKIKSAFENAKGQDDLDKVRTAHREEYPALMEYKNPTVFRATFGAWLVRVFKLKLEDWQTAVRRGP